MRKLRVNPDKVLREPCKPITEITDEIKEIAKDMRDFVDQNSTTVAGLAANQFGENIRMFVLNKDLILEGHEGVFLNPEIVETKGEYRGIEGCLSLPKATNYVDRAAYVQLKYMDLEGNTKLVELGDPSEDADPRIQYSAAAVQHEIDHLDGKLFTDHTSSWNKKRLEKKSRKAYEKIKNKYFKEMLRKKTKELLEKRKTMEKELKEENNIE